MTHIDWIGFTGVTILLSAFFLNLVNSIRKDSLIYLLLNFTGAALACLASVFLNYAPFIILEGCWAFVSALGLIDYFRKSKTKASTDGETDLARLLATLKPKHNAGEFVFCTVDTLPKIPATDVVMQFDEEEGYTVILKREIADHLGLSYSFVASWITLTVHSSLSAVGLTAAFSRALSAKGISCNVVAAFHHDHIFVDLKNTEEAMKTLGRLDS